MKPEYIEQLKKQQPERAHIVGDEQIPHNEWVKIGSPYVWLNKSVIYEEGYSGVATLTIEVFTDVGHGFHCVFVNGNFLFIFKDERVFTHEGEIYMVVDAQEYGVGEYAAIFKLLY